MPKPFKLSSPRPLPPDAEFIDHEGRPHVRLKWRGRSTLFPLTKDGRNYLRPSKCWYFECRDASGTVRRLKGFPDLKATEQLAAETERKASRVRSGFTDPAEEHARRPLADHLKDYSAALEAKGNVDAHNRATVSKISAMLTGCGFAFLSDVDAAKASAWLNDLRRSGAPIDIPPGDGFSSSHVAKLLNVTPDAVRKFVSRHRLPTVGNGPARRLTRESAFAIAERLAQGNGPATINRYITAVRGFFRWLVRLKRIGSDPLDSLTLVNARVDVRHGRRELTVDELQSLLSTTRASGRTFRGLTGRERYFLYLVASGTGFRSNAMANLTPADFDLESGSPVVTLAARFNKSRKTKIQPIPTDVADALRDYLSGKAADALIWGGTWATGCMGAEMLRRDLEAAGIAYAVDGPDGPEYADFHALRHTYLTMLGRNGVDLRTAQELAGHSTPILTARYSHRRLHDLAGAVNKLPALVPPMPMIPVGVPLRMTGTDGDSGVVPGVVAGGIRPHCVAPMCTLGIFGGSSADTPEPLEMKGAGASQHRPASIRSQLPGMDSNHDEEYQKLLCYRYTTG